MKLSSALTLALASTSALSAHALSLPSDLSALSLRDTVPDVFGAAAQPQPPSSEALEKRKGGGGRASGGGKSGSSGSKSGSSSSGSSGSSSSSRTSSSSNTGGRTSAGSGVTARYAGGKYAGGSTVPYSAGTRSPSGITPVLLPLTALAIFPGLWLYGAYAYPYTHAYTFHNATSDANETKPVECLCEAYQECGCDDDGNSTFLSQVVGNGSYAGLNRSLVTVAEVNGSSTILLNGTLPNGTTAAGGSDDDSAAAARFTTQGGAVWVLWAAAVGTGVWFL